MTNINLRDARSHCKIVSDEEGFVHVEQVEHAKHTDDLYVLHVLHGQSKRCFANFSLMAIVNNEDL